MGTVVFYPSGSLPNKSKSALQTERATQTIHRQTVVFVGGRHRSSHTFPRFPASWYLWCWEIRHWVEAECFSALICWQWVAGPFSCLLLCNTSPVPEPSPDPSDLWPHLPGHSHATLTCRETRERLRREEAWRHQTFGFTSNQSGCFMKMLFYQLLPLPKRVLACRLTQ